MAGVCRLVNLICAPCHKFRKFPANFYIFNLKRKNGRPKDLQRARCVSRSVLECYIQCGNVPHVSFRWSVGGNALWFYYSLIYLNITVIILVQSKWISESNFFGVAIKGSFHNSERTTISLVPSSAQKSFTSQQIEARKVFWTFNDRSLFRSHGKELIWKYTEWYSTMFKSTLSSLFPNFILFRKMGRVVLIQSISKTLIFPKSGHYWENIH